MSARPTIDYGRCQRCHERILWYQMAEKPDGSPGGNMPVNAPWVVSDGTKTLVVLDEDNFGHVITRAAEDTTGRESHFATCPEAEHFRKKEKQKTAQGSLFE